MTRTLIPKATSSKRPIRRLTVVLGDQLNLDSAALANHEPDHDLVWMAEAIGEATHVWSSKTRTAYFFAAMRHFAAALERAGFNVLYRPLADDAPTDLGMRLAEDLKTLKPQYVTMVTAGEKRVQRAIANAVARRRIPLEVLEDRHFLCELDTFNDWASSRKQLRMENFYRFMRSRHGILVDNDGPVGGQWNLDAANRQSFGKTGPADLPPWPGFPPDPTTRAVLALVDTKFSSHVGSLSHFDWPVTRDDAQRALNDFIEHRLPMFGPYQDAMWTGEPFLYHSGLSASLNLKLLHPREVISAATDAFQAGHVPLASAEGFIRQILGWREFIRGIYFRYMPDYAAQNALGARHPLPSLYWTGETEMVCLRESVGQTIEHGYAHHIQRLMVTGLFALLCGVEPRQVHEWYLAVYVDAVEWVELPNTLGMSQYADGGLFASKPYIASGRYIDKMSNYCSGCRYDPGKTTGEGACPITTLYWDFLLRHEARFAHHPRVSLMWRHLARKTESERNEIRRSADVFRSSLN